MLRLVNALATLALTAVILHSQTSAPAASTLVVNVPATSNPYLAGMPNGTEARVGDKAPQQSPARVERTLSHAVAVTFTATGAVQHTPKCPPDCDGPNGGGMRQHVGGAEHGISAATLPMTALVGVFLTEDQPDRSSAPRPFDYKAAMRRDDSILSPQLKQIFFIGDGKTRKGALRRYMVPAKATRLYLGVMDGYEWSNNTGSFTVTVAIERDYVDSSMFTVDSNITYSTWACVPGRDRCTPDRAVADEKSAGRFHVVLPAASEWGISVPAGKGAPSIHDVAGTVCLGPDLCVGPEAGGNPAGPGYLAEDRPAGALLFRVIGDRVYFSVNHRKGMPFRDHEGYFEFNVTTQP